MDSGLHVVLGAAGGTGGALVRELRARQLPVRAVTRRADVHLGPDVESMAADLTDVAQARAAVAGARVVYHAANPPYPR